MIKVPIKEEFKTNIDTVKHLVDLYIKELQRTDNFVIEGKVRRATRKSKLCSYRKLIHDELLEIERNEYGAFYGECVEVKENVIQ